MPNRKRILRYVLSAVLLFAALQALWWLLATGYADAFCRTAEWVYSGTTFGPAGEAHFVADFAATGVRQAGDEYFGSAIWLGNAVTRGTWPIPMSTYNMGYVPTTLFLALLIPTPAPWRRRLIGLVIGLALVHLAILARLTWMIVTVFSLPGAHRVYEFSPWKQSLVEWGFNALVQPAGNAYLTALIIWAVMAFRLRDWVLPVAAGGDRHSHAGGNPRQAKA